MLQGLGVLNVVPVRAVTVTGVSEPWTLKSMTCVAGALATVCKGIRFPSFPVFFFSLQLKMASRGEPSQPNGFWGLATLRSILSIPARIASSNIYSTIVAVRSQNTTIRPVTFPATASSILFSTPATQVPVSMPKHTEGSILKHVEHVSNPLLFHYT